MGKYLNKPTGPLAGSVSAPLSPSGEFPILYPALYEFLTLTAWEDGTTRQSGSLTLFVDLGAWKACLNDKDASRVAFISGSSLDGVMQAAEAALVLSTLDWRPTRYNGRRRPQT